jgi:hypothetical protein
VRRDLDNEKKDQKVTDQINEEITADGKVYGVKGIKDGKNKKNHEGEGQGNPPDLRNPLYYPSIEPEKEGPE